MRTSWGDRIQARPRGGCLTGMRTLTLAVLLVVSGFRLAAAGPFCGTELGFAPADRSELPIGPVISFTVEDPYYGGMRHRKARLPKLYATIGRQKVPIATRDVRTGDGVIRFITIKSKAAGKLELWRSESESESESTETEAAPEATYTIVSDWTTFDTPTASITPSQDRRLGPYRWIGDYAALRVDVPAIAFTVKWRRGEKAAWRAMTVPANIETDRSEAWLGERICGMTENIPMSALAKGVELALAAKLPNGRDIAITDGVPTPFVFQPAEPAPKPQRARAVSSADALPN
jgi:hypothetical protein